MIVCVDIDHTISHAAWRDEHIAEARATGKWDLYHSLGKEDKPAVNIISLVCALQMAGHDVYILTARPRKWLRQTYAWLQKNGINVEADHILMRYEDVFAPAVDIKLSLIDGMNVDLLIEDREDVCEAFAKAGITTMMVRLVA
jgi:uncharacterized HAD superfamily protein